MGIPKIDHVWLLCTSRHVHLNNFPLCLDFHRLNAQCVYRIILLVFSPLCVNSDHIVVHQHIHVSRAPPTVGHATTCTSLQSAIHVVETFWNFVFTAPSLRLNKSFQTAIALTHRYFCCPSLSCTSNVLACSAQHTHLLFHKMLFQPPTYSSCTIRFLLAGLG